MSTIIYMLIGLSFFVSFVNLLAQQRKTIRLRGDGRKEEKRLGRSW